MNWQTIPTGTIRYDELLNALLAIWKTQYNAPNRNPDAFSQGYEAGFEEGLDAVAQIAGIAEEFEAAKTNHRAKIKAKLQQVRIEVIEGSAGLLEG